MTPRQREHFQSLQRNIHHLDRALGRLRAEAEELRELCESPESQDTDFTAEDIDRLVRLNDRLAFLGRYLHQCDQSLCKEMTARVVDPEDPLDDFDIEVTLHFMLREDDPAYDEDSDNFLTERRFSLKGSDSEHLLDGDWREHGLPFPGRLNSIAHSWLFHDLYDHDYDIEAVALSLRDCLRIDKIWVRVAVEHQATLDLETGH